MRRSTLYALAALALPASLSAPNGIAYVSDLHEHGNYDIYYMPDVNDPADVIRLTTNGGIDNHPDIYWSGDIETSMLVWASNRDGDFELFMGPLLHPEQGIQQLTHNSIPDRHPHFSADARLIVFDAKCRYVNVYDTVVGTECSIPVPKILATYRRFEALCVYTIGSGRIDTFDIADADAENNPHLWPDTSNSASKRTWVGHPSFSPDGRRILFSASRAMNGTDWEVFSVAYDSAGHRISDLRQHTAGTVYPASANPVSMSGGAHFSHDGQSILYTSTRTPLGNSQLFRIPATAYLTPVHPDNQLTFHNGNDYVPEEMNDGGIVLTSDQGPSICDPDDNEGPSDDLDVVEVDTDGEGRTNLTDPENDNGSEDRDDVLLIGDEVSWFCGVKPNLSPCTYYPKIWNVCFFKFWHDIVNDTAGHQWNDSAYRGIHGKRHLYERAFKEYASFMTSTDPATYGAMLQQMNLYSDYCAYDWTMVRSWWVIASRFGVYDSTVPLPPRLIAPRHDSLVSTGGVIQLDWSDAALGGVTYGIQIARDPGFTTTDVVASGLPESFLATTELVPATVYYWRASASNAFGTTWSNVRRFSTHATGAVDRSDNPEPPVWSLYDNYPNPFTAATTIRFVLDRPAHVVLRIYDLLGREVEAIMDRSLEPGLHSIAWDAQACPSGIYSYRIAVTRPDCMEQLQVSAARTMTLVR